MIKYTINEILEKDPANALGKYMVYRTQDDGLLYTADCKIKARDYMQVEYIEDCAERGENASDYEVTDGDFNVLYRTN